MAASADVPLSQHWYGRGVLACPLELRILREGNYWSLFTNARLSLSVCLTQALSLQASSSNASKIFLLSFLLKNHEMLFELQEVG